MEYPYPRVKEFGVLFLSYSPQTLFSLILKQLAQMGKTALLIIDLQEDFLPPNGSLAVKNGRDIINPIIDLMTNKKYEWDTVVATKDWHPQGHISFASTHKQEPYSTKLIACPDGKQEAKLHTLWPDHCVQESSGSEFPTEFLDVFNEFKYRQDPQTKLILKGYLQDREYYSCFQDIWGLHKTECASYLNDLGITNVVAVGIAYDYCVLNSCIDSQKNGFNTYVVSDLTRSVQPEKDSETSAIYEKNGVEIIKSSDPLLEKLVGAYL